MHENCSNCRDMQGGGGQIETPTENEETSQSQPCHSPKIKIKLLLNAIKIQQFLSELQASSLGGPMFILLTGGLLQFTYGF